MSIMLLVTASIVLSLFPKTISARLHHLLDSLPGVKFTADAKSLTIKYKTEIVNAQKQQKSAKRMEELVPQERPSAYGFKLETYDYPHKRNEPPRATQAVRTNSKYLRDFGTYKVDAVERQVDGKDFARSYYIEWGFKSDPKLIAKIRSTLEANTHSMTSAQ